MTLLIERHHNIVNDDFTKSLIKSYFLKVTLYQIMKLIKKTFSREELTKNEC